MADEFGTGWYNKRENTELGRLSVINLIDDEQWFDLLSPNEKITDGQFIKLNPYQTVWITNFRI